MKDIRDIERDLDDEDETPVTRILDGDYDVGILKEIYEKLEYENQGSEYQEILRSMEPDLEAALQETNYF